MIPHRSHSNFYIPKYRSFDALPTPEIFFAYYASTTKVYFSHPVADNFIS